MARKVVAAILAAGAASRFGSPKQLAKFGSKTLIDLALDALSIASVDQTCVVLGCNFETIRDHLHARQRSNNSAVRIVQNINWKDGLSSSIHAATKIANVESATHLLLLACDQPFVDAVLIEKLLQLTNEKTVEDNVSRDDTTPIVACKFENSVGSPAIFPAAYFGELMALEGDKGAKSVILKSTAPIFLDFPKGAHDIDCPEDLDSLQSSHL